MTNNSLLLQVIFVASEKYTIAEQVRYELLMAKKKTCSLFFDSLLQDSSE